MTARQGSRLTAAVVLVVSTLATILGRHVTTTQVHDIAGYVTAALGALLAWDQAPKAAAVVKKPRPKPRPRPVPPPAQQQPKPVKPVPKLPWFGLDYAFAPHPTTTQLKDLGVRFVCRYLSYDPGKTITPTEASELRAAGIAVVLVWETTGNRALGSVADGRADALAAVEMAKRLGWHDPTVYFAVDFEATGPDVDAYFDGVCSVLGHQGGVYGGYATVAHLLSNRRVGYAWQTYAWSGGKWHPGAHLLQYDNDRTVGSASVDFNHAMADDFGQWAP